MFFEFTSYIYQDCCEVPVEVAVEFLPGYQGSMYQRNGDPGDPPESDEVNIVGVQAHGCIEVKFDLLSDEEQNRIIGEAEDEGNRRMGEWQDEEEAA